MVPPGKRLFTEAFGTFWLVFGGCGSAALAGAFPSLGIGLADVALQQLWLFWLAPLIGGVLGGIVYRVVAGDPPAQPIVGEALP